MIQNTESSSKRILMSLEGHWEYHIWREDDFSLMGEIVFHSDSNFDRMRNYQDIRYTRHLLLGAFGKIPSLGIFRGDDVSTIKKNMETVSNYLDTVYCLA